MTIKTHWRPLAVGLLLAALCPCQASRAAAPGTAAPADSQPIVVLRTNGFFRLHFTWKTAQVRLSSGKLAHGAIVPSHANRVAFKPTDRVAQTPPPPAGWRAPRFDDSSWARARGPVFTRRTRKLALICLRGKFEVTDPATVKGLTLSLTFRGGAIVYLNGAEVARRHLPAGEIRPDTPAEDYPKEAYVDPDGYLLRWVGFGDPEKYGDRFGLRARTLEAPIPAAMLRRGVNVLAVELHRAPVSEILVTASPRRHNRTYTLWGQVSLERLRLTAAGGSGVVSNTARPRGLQVWRHSVLGSVHTPDFGDPTEPPGPLVIRGTRNGAFSGQVVVGADEALAGLSATAGDLTGKDGARIPASAVQVRFGVLGYTGESAMDRLYKHSGGQEQRYPSGVRRFDGLEPAPPAAVPVDTLGGGAVLPVWVTVRVPRDAKGGRYSGKVTLRTADAEAVVVPLQLHVSDWILPDPKQFVTHVGLIQSPDTLAIKYNVPMWSEKHWALVEKSFALMGQVGTKVLYLPLLRKTYFGNEHSMVRWLARAGGGYGHDFSIVEKYLDVAIKHLGRIPVVCAYCWDVNTGSAYMGGGHEVPRIGLPITRKDPATGELTEGSGPKWGDPAVRTFWKPVLDRLAKLLAQRGLAGSLMVGIAGDRHPDPSAVADLAAVAPAVPWVVSSHSCPSTIHDQPVGYQTTVWGVTGAPDPSVKRWLGWQNPRRVTAFPRFRTPPLGLYLRDFSPMGVYRIAAEGCITGVQSGVMGLRGFGRCGADFWPVLAPSRRGRGPRPVCGRYPETNTWHGGWLHNSTPHVLAPGSDGPISSARFEMLREGVQEAEARIFIEKALADDALRARLGDELAGRAQKLLDHRVRINRFAVDGYGSDVSWTWFAGSGWQERSGALYDAAAEVAAKLAER